MSTIAPPNPPARPEPTTRVFIPSTPPPRRVWTAGATIALLLGTVMSIAAAALLIGAGAIHLIDEDRRQGDYLTTDTADLATDGYALTVEEIDLDGLSGDWLFGEARVRVTPAQAGQSVFVGVAHADDAAAYLDDVNHSAIVEVDDSSPTYDDRAGGAPAAPTDLDIWTTQASGQGTQELTWTPSDADWTVVTMNSDGSAAVHVTADVGATVPLFEAAQHWFVIVGAFLGAFGMALVTLAMTSSRRAGRSPRS